MAGANRLNWPRRGSLQVWHRSRSRKKVARPHAWKHLDIPKLLEFIGYKTGMTHVQYTDAKATSLTKGMVVTIPATIVECPPLKPVAIRSYTHSPTGLHLSGMMYADKLPKGVNKPSSTFPVPNPSTSNIIRLLVATQPSKTTIGKKTPDLLELQI